MNGLSRILRWITFVLVLTAATPFLFLHLAFYSQGAIGGYALVSVFVVCWVTQSRWTGLAAWVVVLSSLVLDIYLLHTGVLGDPYVRAMQPFPNTYLIPSIFASSLFLSMTVGYGWRR